MSSSNPIPPAGAAAHRGQELTSRQFDAVMARCAGVFDKKAADYGDSWRIMRPSTITDQIFIKACRLRNIETGMEAMVDEDPADEFAGIVNYGLMALVQLAHPVADMTRRPNVAEATALYREQMARAKALMQAKNHDYGEAWRGMRVSSFTDIILTKLKRIKEIEDNSGHTQVSEGPEGNYLDIVNYAVFALIKLGEQEGTL